MKVLLDIPILDWHGPEFLEFYLMAVVGALLWTLFRIQSLDQTRGMDSPTVPTEIDPFETAFLRGGMAELGRLIILDLIARKYLVRAEDSSKKPVSKIERAKEHPNTRFLIPVERYVFDWLSKKSDASEIMAALPQSLESGGYGLQYQSTLEKKRLLRTPEARRARWTATIAPLCVIGVLGLAKLVVAAVNGHRNVGFLIILMLIGGGLILAVAGTRRRCTYLGDIYLQRLQHAMGSLQKRIGTLAAGEPCDQFLLAVAIFGIATLTGTTYAYYPDMFQRAAQSGSSCGSGCGSSCSSGGSSCGGGCGGGGCGGCGS